MLELAWKSTLVLGAAGIAAALLRRSSASVRHLIWLSALASLLVLPLAIVLAPGWQADVIASVGPVVAVPAATVVRVAARAPSSFPVVQVVWYVWLAGAVLLLIQMAVGHARAAGWARRARPVNGVRISREISVPLVCGLRRPVILLPEEAIEWPADRLWVVVAHESMHVSRHDMISQALAQVACAIYWPHPLVWWAAAWMKKECEQACDDGVLAMGEKASTYAGHLMEILRGLAAPNSKLQGGIAMIRGSELEQRLAALLSPNRKRQPAGRRVAVGALLAAAVVLVPLAALRAPAQVSPGTIAGVVHDPSGAPVAGASVAIPLTGGARQVTETSPTGEFTFAALPSGTYQVTVQAPGFKVYRENVQVSSLAGTPRLAVNLALGEISQSLQISAGETVRRRPAGITGNVQPSRLIRQPRPIYPEDCKAAGVEGTVKLAGVVSTTGALINIQPSGPQPDYRLVKAATEAAAQWLYTPTLLNGNPVEVVTEIAIQFTKE